MLLSGFHVLLKKSEFLSKYLAQEILSVPFYRIIVIFISVAIGSFLFFFLSGNHLRVVLEFSTTAPGPGEVFYAAPGEPFRAKQNKIFLTIPDGAMRSYQVDIKPLKFPDRIRLDLATGPGSLTLGSMRVRAVYAWFVTKSRAISLIPISQNDVKVLSLQGSRLDFQSTGPDPYLEFLLPVDLVRSVHLNWYWLGVGAALFAVAVTGIVIWFHAMVIRSIRVHVRSHAMWSWEFDWLSAVALRMSDRGAIMFTPRSITVVLVLLCLAFVGIVFRLNQSSIGVWDDYFVDSQSRASVIVGEPRAIRSDEWLVFTPWMMSQAEKKFPVENFNVGALKSPLLASMPTRDITSAVQPEFWGFALFDVERAISWHFMYKLFGLLISSYLFFLIVTGGSLPISLAGSGWIVSSSYTQWWLSSNLPEIVTGFFLSLVGFYYLFFASRIYWNISGALLLFFGAVSFIFQLYPPFQIPLLHLGIVVAVSWFFCGVNRQRASHKIVVKLISLLACLVVISCLVIYFIGFSAPTIEAMMATLYPGRRFSVGGGLDWRWVFDGIFELWRFGEAEFPYGDSNASEASKYVLLFPLIFLAVILLHGFLWREPAIISLIVFCLLLCGWMIVPLPETVGNFISRYSLLSFVPPARASLGLGVGSIILACIWVAKVGQASPVKLKMRMPIFLLISCMLVYFYGNFLRAHDPEFFTQWRIFLGCILVFGLALAVAHGSALAFGLSVIAIAIPGLNVNPVTQGLGALTDRVVLNAAISYSESVDDPRWIIVGSLTLPQAFKARGLDVFGGATYVPDTNLMLNFDPMRRFDFIWNRYAHIVISTNAELKAPKFDLLGSDVYSLTLDICSSAIDALGINRVAYVNSAPQSDLRCLREIGQPINGIFFYEKIPQAVQLSHPERLNR